jgi:cytochrome P450
VPARHRPGAFGAVPLLVISEILGVPEDEWRRCYEWSEAVIPGATDWPQERRDELMGDMVTYLLDATKQRRSSPREDVLSELATVTVDGDQLSDDELSMFLVQLLVAGNETTRNMLSAGLVALADAPEQWRRLVGRARAREELLSRRSSGTPPR